MTPLFEQLSIDIEEMMDPREGPAGLRHHSLFEIVIIALCSTVVGGESFEEMKEYGVQKSDWLKKYLVLEHGIPSVSTFRRVLSSLCSKEFGRLLSIFHRDFSEIAKELNGEMLKPTIAIDGKTHRGTRVKDGSASALHTVSAFDTEMGLTIGQVAVADKSNEITAIPELLNTLNIKGAVVTIDAMGCQKTIAEQIQKKKAGFVFSLKGNQETLYDGVKAIFADAPNLHDLADESGRFTTIEKGHGRIETRTCLCIPAVNIIGLAGWPPIKSFVAVDSTREIAGKVENERRYFISDQATTSEVMARYIRAHWAIENQLHWVLDATFSEDASTARMNNAAKNLGILRRITLNLIRSEKTEKGSKRIKRMRASLSEQFLEKVLFHTAV